MKPIENEFQVGPDGTVTLHDLKPGSKVRVLVYDAEEGPERVPHPTIPGGYIVKPHLPRVPWDKFRGKLAKYERPFDPAVDPDDWEANR